MFLDGKIGPGAVVTGTWDLFVGNWTKVQCGLAQNWCIAAKESTVHEVFRGHRRGQRYLILRTLGVRIFESCYS
jgi:hypothetical protein